MKKIMFLIAFTVLWPVCCMTQTQPVLQPWVEVYGTVGGEKLGGYVKGVTPTVNLPYRAAIFKGGSTSFYRLQTPTDSVPQLTLPGGNVLIGDLNNDGIVDVVLWKSVNDYDTVCIYWGTATGVDTVNPLRIPGENQFDGLRPDVIGDVNNDGKQDLILTAGGYPNLYGNGKVYVFLNPVSSSTPNATMVGDTTRAGLGVTCAIADLNDDGFRDLVIKGINQTGPPGPQRYDYVNIYWGVGVDTVNLTLGLQMRTQNINSGGLACFDVNGDGKSDLLWTARDTADWIYVHYGKTQFDTVPNLNLANPFPGIANFGRIITDAGDMNGDGYNDILLGCPDATITSGFVIVYSGGPRIDGTFDAAVGRSAESYFGWSVASLGDITGDGLSDIIVGAPKYDFASDKGYWGIFKGDTAIHVTAVKDDLGLPEQFVLEQAYPNPFNPKTTIRYELKSSAFITIKVYDLLGREIVTLVNISQQPGYYQTEFDGSKYTSGIYLYQITAIPQRGNIFTQTRKFALIK